MSAGQSMVVASSWGDAVSIPIVVVAIVCSIVAAEIHTYGTRIALALVSLATRALPDDRRARYREEWTDHVLSRSADGSHLLALLWGIGVLVAGLRQSQLMHRTRRWLWSDGSDTLLIASWATLSLSGLYGAGGIAFHMLMHGLRFEPMAMMPGLLIGVAYGPVVGFARERFDEVFAGLYAGRFLGMVVGLLFGVSAGVDLGWKWGLGAGGVTCFLVVAVASPIADSAIAEGPGVLARLRSRFPIEAG